MRFVPYKSSGRLLNWTCPISFFLYTVTLIPLHFNFQKLFKPNKSQSFFLILERANQKSRIESIMEDSFRVRVERAFGALPIPSSASLWSLSEDEIKPEPKPKPKPDSEPKPYPTSSSSSSGFKVELENDLDDEEEDENVAGPSKPSDYNDEQWEIRSSIGLDCTLDFEVLSFIPFHRYH